MGKMKCYECGRIFDEDDAECRQEYVGEFWGAPAYQNINVCPHCGSDEISDFKYPLDECSETKCDYDCDNCELKGKEEN